MKFVNKRTGVILEPRNSMVEEQLRKSTEYAPYSEQKEQSDEPESKGQPKKINKVGDKK